LYDISEEELERFAHDSLSRITTSDIDALQARLVSQREYLLRHFAEVWRIMMTEQVRTASSSSSSSDDSSSSASFTLPCAIDSMQYVLDGLKVSVVCHMTRSNASFSYVHT
jgi:hypothetical protein